MVAIGAIRWPYDGGSQGLVTAFGLVILTTSLLGIPVAVAGAAEPVIVPGNPQCEVGEFSFKDDNGPPSPATNGEVAITYSDATHTTVMAGPGFTIDQVIIKAGSSAAIYSIPPFVDLASIINDGGQTADISHVEVCYSTATTTTTADPSTTTTTDGTTTTTAATTTTTAPTTTTSEVAGSTSSTTSTSTTTTSQTTTTTSGPTATTSPGETTPTTGDDATTGQSTPPVSVCRSKSIKRNCLKPV